MSRLLRTSLACTGHGRLSSWSRFRPIAKLGVIKLMESVAEEYRDRGIRANAVMPSIIDTPANRAAMPDADSSRWVSPEAIAAVMRFLASDEAAIISGAAIPVYGRA